MKLQWFVTPDKKVGMMVLDDADKVLVNTNLSPDDTRNMANDLRRCADIAEGIPVPDVPKAKETRQ